LGPAFLLPGDTGSSSKKRCCGCGGRWLLPLPPLPARSFRAVGPGGSLPPPRSTPARPSRHGRSLFHGSTRFTHRFFGAGDGRGFPQTQPPEMTKAYRSCPLQGPPSSSAPRPVMVWMGGNHRSRRGTEGFARQGLAASEFGSESVESIMGSQHARLLQMRPDHEKMQFLCRRRLSRSLRSRQIRAIRAKKRVLLHGLRRTVAPSASSAPGLVISGGWSLFTATWRFFIPPAWRAWLGPPRRQRPGR